MTTKPKFKLVHRDPGILLVDDAGTTYAKFIDPIQAERALKQMQAEGRISRHVVKGQGDDD